MIIFRFLTFYLILYYFYNWFNFLFIEFLFIEFLLLNFCLLNFCLLNFCLLNFFLLLNFSLFLFLIKVLMMIVYISFRLLGSLRLLDEDQARNCAVRFIWSTYTGSNVWYLSLLTAVRIANYIFFLISDSDSSISSFTIPYYLFLSFISTYPNKLFSICLLLSSGTHNGRFLPHRAARAFGTLEGTGAPRTTDCQSGIFQKVRYCTVLYSTVQYSTVQYSTVQYSTVQYSTIQHIPFVLLSKF